MDKANKVADKVAISNKVADKVAKLVKRCQNHEARGNGSFSHYMAKYMEGPYTFNLSDGDTARQYQAACDATPDISDADRARIATALKRCM